MTSSMTAFSRSQVLLDQGILIWELKSVNNRYLDIQFRLPETMRNLEPLLRDRLRQHLARGKVECSLKFDRNLATESTLALNEALAKQLISAAEHIAALGAQPGTLPATDILAWPGVLTLREDHSENLQQTLLASFDQTLEQFCQAREREGGELAKLILQRLTAISAEVKKIRAWVPEIIAAQRAKIIARFEACSITLDTERLEQELVYLAQKTDVDEELDRIDTHVTEVKRTLETEKSAGRRLDFLMQELNREANTLASKSVSSECTQSAVELKVLIEQMREQIQNIE
ncbi:MAG TPA: YicC/YloC family endoribonuclease [Pseudomonadales bacterium]